MPLYLVQHGKATSKDEDPDRPLTHRGRDDVGRVGRAAGRMRVEIARIHHSPKLRARQTAEILADTLGPDRPPSEMEGLKALDDPEIARDAVERGNGPMLLVGHLPHMDRLSSLLVTGDAEAGVIAFRNGAIVRLGRGDEGWSVDWILAPEMAG